MKGTKEMKGTKNILKLIIAAFLLVIVFGQGISTDNTVYAADSTVKIYLGDSKTARHHRAEALGNTTEQISYEVTGYTVKSATYTSSNPTSFRVINEIDGTCNVETLKEGTGDLILTIKTTTGETLIERVFISVYTCYKDGNELISYPAIINKSADVYRGASKNTGSENDDNKGTLQKNKKVDVVGSCEGYYLIRAIDGSTFADNLDTGFVAKADVNVLLTKIKLNEEAIAVEKNSNISLKVSQALPDFAKDKTVTWSSSNTSVATVNSNGKVTGKSQGTVTITATANDGSNKKSSCEVTVYKSVTGAPGWLNKDTYLYKIATTSHKRGEAKKQQTLTIVGESENYYRVKMDKSVYTDGSSEYCFVPKSAVELLPTKIIFNYSQLVMYPNQSIRLVSTITPNTANKTLLWTSQNVKVASVNNGVINANIGGVTTITGKTLNGKSANCKVTVYVPVTKVQTPLYTAIQKGKSKKITTEYTPETNSGNKKVWTSNNKNCTMTNNKVTAKKVGTSLITAQVTPPKPTVGKALPPVSSQTFVTVYKKIDKFYVATKNKNVKTYPGAEDKYNHAKRKKELNKEIKKIKDKDTLLRVTGESGKYYYIEYVDDPEIKGFVLKSQVYKVNLKHKRLLINQSSEIEKDKTIILKETNTTKVTSEVIYNKNIVKIEKSNNKYTGKVTALKEGVTYLKVTRKNKNTKKVTYWQIHVSVPQPITPAVGYTNTESKVYKCATDKCYKRTLPENTKVTVTDKYKSKLRITYTINGKNESMYISSKAVSWIEISPVIVKKGNEKTAKITYHNIKEKLARTDSDQSENIAKIKYKGTTVQVKGQKEGFSRLKVSFGKYKANVSISVYNPFNVKGFYKNKAELISAASKTSKYAVKQRYMLKDDTATIIGECRGFFLINTNHKNIGVNGKGFVLKEKISYIKMLDDYKNIQINHKADVKVHIYNADPTSFTWSDGKGILTLSKQSTKVKSSGRLATYAYTITGRKEGTVSVEYSYKNNKDVKDNCYVSIYSSWGNRDGYMKEDSNYNSIKLYQTYQSASDKQPKSGKIKEYASAKITGKCGEYFYINNSRFVKKSNVTYLVTQSASNSMYRYKIKKDIYSYLVNIHEGSKRYKEINYSIVDKNGKSTNKAKIKSQFDDKNRKYLKMQATKPGEVYVVASYINPIGVKLSNRIKITINNVKLTIHPDIKELAVGQKSTLKASVTHFGEVKAKWSSSDTTVANVNKSGEVKALKPGTVTITARWKDLSKKCKISTYVGVQSLTLNKTKLELTIGNEKTLKATIKPNNAKDKTVTWISSDNVVATVDKNGRIFAKSTGTAIITAKAKNKQASCTVTVKDLDIVSREDWEAEPIKKGAEDILEDKEEDEEDDEVKLAKYYHSIVIHHTQRMAEEKIKDLQKECQKVYQDINYHYIIYPNGKIYEGRAINYKGEHVAENNTGRIGVALTGNFSSEEDVVQNLKDFWQGADPKKPTESQLNSLEKLIKYLDYKYEVGDIAGHRNFYVKTPTNCPGNLFYESLGTRQFLVNDKWGGDNNVKK